MMKLYICISKAFPIIQFCFDLQRSRKKILLFQTSNGCLRLFEVYMGDDTYAPSARFGIRCKEYTTPYATQIFPKGKMKGSVKFFKRKNVLEHCWEEEGSCIMEVGIQITVTSQRVWWYPPKLSDRIQLDTSVRGGSRIVIEQPQHRSRIQEGYHRSCASCGYGRLSRPHSCSVAPRHDVVRSLPRTQE